MLRIGLWTTLCTGFETGFWIDLLSVPLVVEGLELAFMKCMKESSNNNTNINDNNDNNDKNNDKDSDKDKDNDNGNDIDNDNDNNVSLPL